MRTLLCAAALFSIALLGAGCKKASPLVGKWDASIQGPMGPANVGFEFTDANAFTMTLGPVNVKGDYKIEGEKLTLTVKDFEGQGVTAANKEAAKKAGGMDKPMDMTVKFVSDDEISLSGGAGMPGGGTTFKRVKS